MAQAAPATLLKRPRYATGGRGDNEVLGRAVRWRSRYGRLAPRGFEVNWDENWLCCARPVDTWWYLVSWCTRQHARGWRRTHFQQSCHPARELARQNTPIRWGSHGWESHPAHPQMLFTCIQPLDCYRCSDWLTYSDSADNSGQNRRHGLSSAPCEPRSQENGDFE